MHLAVIGVGGHAKVVAATARAAGFAIGRVVDDDPDRWGQALHGATVDGPTSRVLEDPEALAVLAIGDGRVRARLAAMARCRFARIVHPSAIVDPSVTLGDGTVVFAGAVIQPDSRIGRHAILNTGASVDHDCVVGDFVHIGPGARLAGGVTVGEGALLGIGSAVVPGRTVGAWTRVGAGAVVVGDLPPDVVAVGVPARVR